MSGQMDKDQGGKTKVGGGHKQIPGSTGDWYLPPSPGVSSTCQGESESDAQVGVSSNPHDVFDGVCMCLHRS